ncbi:MAG: LysE family translocator [Microvirga sp.]
MTYADNLWLFTALLFGIVVVPGMDMLYVLASTLSGGLRTGLAATAGLMAGGAVHTLFGALGVGILLAWAPLLFNAMLLAGTAYMAWIGVTLLRSAITVDPIGRAASQTLRAAFRRGAATCLLNPKAYLFVVAVYPQFMRPHFGPIWSQALVMGALTAGMQFAVYGGLALAASRSARLLTGNPGVSIWLGRGAGLLLIGMAAATAWSGFASYGTSAPS